MKTRIRSLDTLKGIAALLVIWIHEQFPGVTGQLINRIGAFAVPVFFMVSGYFRASSSREKIAGSIRHILFLLACTYTLSLARTFVFNGFSISAVADVLATVFTFKWLVLWLVLNVTAHISGVAWFLFALLYCYLLHWMFHRWVKDRRIFLLIPVCIAAGLAVRLVLPSVGTNNAWFCGIPCYLLGRWFRETRDSLVRCSAGRFLLAALVGLALLIVSVFAVDVLSYPGAFLLAGALFCLCIRFPSIRGRLLERMGSTYNFFIYIGHALMIHIFNVILPVGDSLLLAWTRPVLLAGTTVGCAAVWYDLIRRKKA